MVKTKGEKTFLFQIILQSGTAFVDHFRYSSNPLMRRIWSERMEPVEDLFSTVREISVRSTARTRK